MVESFLQNKSSFFDIYKGKNILITGHTGFKGSWLSVWLNALGANIIGYSLNPPSTPSLFTEAGLENKINHITGDVRDLDKLSMVFKNHKPEIVFHLAAQALVRDSYLSPKSTFDTNVGGTVNVMEAIRNSPDVKTFINVTSDKCYKNNEWIWGYRENDPMGGDDPYSASKGCAELVFSSYYKSFFINKNIGMASVRAGNVIGGGDWAKDRLIPDCVRSIIDGDTIIIRNPHAIRPWQFVLEPLSGYLLLGALLFNETQKYSGGWNFGPDIQSTIRVEKIVESFLSMWGAGKWAVNPDSNDGSKEARSLALCCDKAKSYLKWQPALSLEEALKLTTEWYKSYYEKQDIYYKCIDQIDYYTNKAKEKKIEWAI